MTFDIDLVEPPRFALAIRALRRPMNKPHNGNETPNEDDIRLARKLVLRGDDHAKFARLIDVGMTVRAPRYFWIEFATYRVGVESVSESTMHRKLDGFSMSDFEEGSLVESDIKILNDISNAVKCSLFGIDMLKRMIPEGFLQTRDIKSSYQALRHIYFARRSHRLPHWRAFCEFIETLPYAKDMICPEI